MWRFPKVHGVVGNSMNVLMARRNRAAGSYTRRLLGERIGPRRSFAIESLKARYQMDSRGGESKNQKHNSRPVYLRGRVYGLK